MRETNKIHFTEIESTNDYALKNMEDIQDGTVIYADVQTKGKGRNSRTWVSEKGNLFMSLVLKPEYNLGKKNSLCAIVHYTAVVLTRVLETKYSVKAKIKWPNDLLVDNKKIAGILIEAVIQGSNLQGIVVGIGVNLNMEKDLLERLDQAATSLNLLLNQKISRDKFLDYLLEEFFSRYEKLLEKGFSLIKKEYILKNMFLGKMVKAVVFGKMYHGLAKGLDDAGQLILECGGSKEVISAGDIIC
ncbi:MAG: biotin--[acetyl-CoA-carboxylase] ligase [Actinobacteria bacterium]|nr:biotin--[acetyl-CoA-carboxylase] ligase [Actinomycetota bacterium]